MHCPYCKERIKEGALRCKHCHASLNETADTTDDSTMRYLQNGFSKVNTECDRLEDKVKARTGFIFIRHEYSEDELMEAAGRIESFVEKIQSDIEIWNSSGQVSQRVECFYNENARQVSQRLERISRNIQERESTLWEKVCTVFKRIASKLFPMFHFKMVAGKPKQRFIAEF
jgi:hypothetical protein